MKANLLTGLVIVAVIAVAAFFAWQSMHPGENATNSEAARALSGSADETRILYTDLDGNPIDLSQYAGKVRVVNSWATWCPFCVNELPDFGTLAAEIPPEEGVVIAINRAEPGAKAQAFLNKLTGLEAIVFVKDESDTFYESVGGFAMPETIFYRADGSIAVHKRGHMTLEEMREHYQTARTPAAE